MKNTKYKFLLLGLLVVIIVLVSWFFVSQNTKSKIEPNIQPPSQNYQDPQLIGIWKGDSEENPGFEIKGDKLYVNETGSTYLVDSSKNITINYPGFVFKGKYNIVNNKLYITSGSNTDTYSRWCPDKNDVCN